MDAVCLQVSSAKAKLEKSVSGDAFPLDYSTSMRVIRDALHAVSPAPVVVSEGANTMDNARCAFESQDLSYVNPCLAPSPSRLSPLFTVFSASPVF